jgi:predicted lipid-binding transport protein (Tim44 family)
MPRSSDAISLVIFALLAVFVIWKLRSVLGTRPGNEPPPGPFAPPRPDAESARGRDARQLFQVRGLAARAPVQVQAPDRWKAFAEPGSSAWSGLDAIAASDPTFDAAGFARGASKAYDLVITAFAAGDRDTLRNLLAPEVYESFDREIAAAQARGETRSSTIVSLETRGFEDARASEGNAQIEVRFASRLISATRDSAGTVIDGDPEKITDHLDVWTFARPLASSDPNWKLAATRAG